MTITQLTKEKQLPTGWKWVKLGDVCEFLDHIRKPINNTERNTRIARKLKSELYPYYGANGQVGWIDDYLFDEPLILLAEDGGFFGSHDKPIAYAAKGKYWVNNHAHVLRPKSCIDFNFCVATLSIRPDIGKLVTGNTRPKLNQTIAATIPIPLPPLPEQKRIADILTKQLALAEQTKKAALEKLEAEKKLKESLLNDVFPKTDNLPIGWKWAKLGDVCNIRGGKRLPKGYEFAKAKTEHPYIRVQDFAQMSVSESNFKYIDNNTYQKISRYIIQKEDVYISIAGTIGLVGTIPNHLDNANLTENAARFCLDLNVLNKHYITLYLNSENGQSSIRERTNTVGQPKLAITRIRTIPIPISPLPEQKQIVEKLSKQLDTADKTLKICEDQLEAINKLPASLLQKAFNIN